MKSYTFALDSEDPVPTQLINYSHLFEPVKLVDMREIEDHKGTQHSDLIPSSLNFELDSDSPAEVSTEPESREGIPSGDIDKDDHTPMTSLRDLPAVYAEVRKFGRNPDSDKPRVSMESHSHENTSSLKIDPDSDGPALESREDMPGSVEDNHTPLSSLGDLSVPVYAEVRKFGRNRDSDKPCVSMERHSHEITSSLKIDPDSDGPAPESWEDTPGSVEDNYTPLSSLGDLSVPATNHDSDEADMSMHKHSLESVPASSDSAEGVSPGSVAAEDVGARDPQLDLDTRYSAEFEDPGYESIM